MSVKVLLQQLDLPLKISILLTPIRVLASDSSSLLDYVRIISTPIIIIINE